MGVRLRSELHFPHVVLERRGTFPAASPLQFRHGHAALVTVRGAPSAKARPSEPDSVSLRHVYYGEEQYKFRDEKMPSPAVDFPLGPS